MTAATASDTVFLHTAGSLRGGGVVVTASITNETVDEFELAKGNAAIAVIKASDVMVGVD